MELDGVLLDQFNRAAVRVDDPGQRKTWKHVCFGPHSAARDDGLFSRMKLATAGCKRKPARSRLNIRPAFRDMKEYEERHPK